jgi:hypothetical protein
MNFVHFIYKINKSADNIYIDIQPWTPWIINEDTQIIYFPNDHHSDRADVVHYNYLDRFHDNDKVNHDERHHDDCDRVTIDDHGYYSDHAGHSDHADHLSHSSHGRGKRAI